MEDCFTTIWYVNCSQCEAGPMTTSKHDPTFKVLLICETVLLFILLLALWGFFTFKKSAEFVFPRSDAINRCV